MGEKNTQGSEVISEKLGKGFRILEGKEQYDPSIYSGPVEAAEKEFKEVLLLDPNCYGALLGIGKCYSYNPQQYGEAIAAFRRAMEICPGEADPYYQTAVTLFQAGERGILLSNIDPYEEALQYFHKALNLSYTSKAWLYNYIGTTHFRMGNYEEAIIWFERSAESLKEEGGWIPSTFNLAAQANEHLGDFADAIRWYERLIKHGFRAKEDEIRQKIKNLKILEKNRKKAI